MIEATAIIERGRAGIGAFALLVFSTEDGRLQTKLAIDLDDIERLIDLLQKSKIDLIEDMRHWQNAPQD